MIVRDLMTVEVVAVHPETPLKEVARALVERRISGVPVVDGEGRLVGVVSEADFLVKEAHATDRRRRGWALRWLLGERGVEAERDRITATTAGEAMTSPPASIAPERSLSEAARVMTERQVNRLPVVDRGRLVGIITRADIVRAYARTDDDLFSAAQDMVRGVDGLRVVSVDEGVVRLAGTVSHRAVAMTASRVVAAIDGVVGVNDEGVAWLEDAEPRTVPGWSGDEPGMGPGSRSA